MSEMQTMVGDLELTELEVSMAYAFSKITIIDEMNQKDKYDKLQFVEFLDFLCRIAFIKFKNEKHLS